MHSTRLTRPPDKSIRAGCPESMVKRISRPPPEITQDETQTKDTHAQFQDRD